MVYVTIKKHVSSSTFYSYNHLVLWGGGFEVETLPCFPQSLKLTKRVKEMCSRTPDITHTVILIGGGNKK